MYFVSKTLAEKAAWKFAEENKLDFISIIPTLVVGPFLMPSMPPSLITALSLITGIYIKSAINSWIQFWNLVSDEIFHCLRKWSPLFDYKARALCTLGWSLQFSHFPVWASTSQGEIHLLLAQCQRSWACKIAQRKIPRI